jgi:hypothetical protein
VSFRKPVSGHKFLCEWISDGRHYLDVTATGQVQSGRRREETRGRRPYQTLVDINAFSCGPRLMLATERIYYPCSVCFLARSPRSRLKLRLASCETEKRRGRPCRIGRRASRVCASQAHISPESTPSFPSSRSNG